MMPNQYLVPLIQQKSTCFIHKYSGLKALVRKQPVHSVVHSHPLIQGVSLLFFARGKNTANYLSYKSEMVEGIRPLV